MLSSSKLAVARLIKIQGMDFVVASNQKAYLVMFASYGITESQSLCSDGFNHEALVKCLSSAVACLSIDLVCCKITKNITLQF